MTSSANTTNHGLGNLPKSFVTSMRTLFDIMDDRHTGYVKFLGKSLLLKLFNKLSVVIAVDIEKRWHDDNTQSLPRGFLESLRKVTPPNGFLSFKQFCAGLQLCLLRNKSFENRSSAFNSTSVSHIAGNTLGIPNLQDSSSTFGSRPLHPAVIKDQVQKPKQPRTNATIAPPLRGGISVTRNQRSERTVSMPQLDPVQTVSNYSEENGWLYKQDIKMGVSSSKHYSKPSNNFLGPPKPPRVSDRDQCSSLDRNLDHREVSGEKIGFSSLEREIRYNRRLQWERQLQERQYNGPVKSANEGKRERGGSLERLLDSREHESSVALNKNSMRSVLQSWYKGKRADAQDTVFGVPNLKKDLRLPLSHFVPSDTSLRGKGDGTDGIQPPQQPVPKPTVSQARNIEVASVMDDKRQKGTVFEGDSDPGETYSALNRKQPTRRKDQTRRHTLQNGVDINMIRRLRQLEAERDMLYQGLDIVERARGWYKRQLLLIAEKMHYLPQLPNCSEPTIESQQEKLHFQLARIHEVNSHLCALMDAADNGLPSHMNLALPSPASMNVDHGTDNSRTVLQLKEQNHQLTEEVSMKSERITALEREKAALLRELFQSRSKQEPHSSTADSTFM